MDRGRERRYESNRGFGGETYRPSERNEPTSRSSYRSPPRRPRSPPPFRGRYAAETERRRSRSPPYTGRGDPSYRRPRSPPRRGYSPRREERPRSPPLRARRYSRSPIRARSPPPRRRETSPYERRVRSPPPPRRAPSPRERFERKPYSPPRDTRSRYLDDTEHRPRERSRSPLARRPPPRSRAASPISSRVSSPPIPPDRIIQTNSRPRSPIPRDFRASASSQGAAYRQRSPPPAKAYSPAPRSPPQEQAPYRSPPRRDQRDFDLPNQSRHSDVPRQSQSSVTTRPDEARPPPSRPLATNHSYARDPPTGPASAKPVPISAHNRPGSTSILSAPTRPRGGSSAARPDSRDHPYGGPPSHRGGRPPTAAPYHNSRFPYDSRGSPSEAVPNGPRPRHGGPPAPSYDAPRHAPPFRSNNSSSTTYPRTQRFATTNHLASLPAVVPGGSALPSADPAAAKKINQLEEDADRLRKQIDEKQKEKRVGLRDWDVRERESRREGLRSELAEAQLESFSGEVIGGQAF